MMAGKGDAAVTRADFERFYHQVYLAEHRHPANVALHVTGTLAALALVGVAIVAGPLWLALLFPVVHAAPGLVGHRLFERNAAVGDVRVLRRDFPAWWFIIANHRLTLALLFGRHRPG
jgi:hypothetical protein